MFGAICMKFGVYKGQSDFRLFYLVNFSNENEPNTIVIKIRTDVIKIKTHKTISQVIKFTKYPKIVRMFY